MAPSSRTLIVLLLSGVGLPGQVVVPPSHAALEGTTSTNVPFGRSTAMRCQLAYDGSLFPRAGVIDAIALRLDGGTTAAGKSVELELRASTMPLPLLSMQGGFAINVGADVQTVFARRLLSLPPLGTAATPSPFHCAIPFDAAFAFDPARGPLLLDFAVHGQPPGAYPLDATYVCESPTEYYGPAGCGPQGGLPLAALAATRQVMWGQSVTLQVRDARPFTVAGLFLGSIEQGQWGGVTLPFDLSPLGAAGCPLSIDVLTSVYGQTDVTGVLSFTFGLPARPSLVGNYVRFQGVAAEPSANALGIITSQGAKVRVCGWERVARVWASGASATDGFREIGLAPPLSVSLR